MLIRRVTWPLALLSLLLASVPSLRSAAVGPSRLALSEQSESKGVAPDLYAGLKWRNIGPFHGGRISAVTGVVGEAGTFYVGAPQGGVWKTTSAGATWYQIFDKVTEADSIGAIQVAPSDKNTIYVGTGDSIR